MSVITGITLCAAVGEDFTPEQPKWLREVNVWLAARNPVWGLTNVTDHFGGLTLGIVTAGAGLNRFDEDEADFIQFVRGYPWAMPEKVVLIVIPEEGPTMVWRPDSPSDHHQ